MVSVAAWPARPSTCPPSADNVNRMEPRVCPSRSEVQSRCLAVADAIEALYIRVLYGCV